MYTVSSGTARSAVMDHLNYLRELTAHADERSRANLADVELPRLVACLRATAAPRRLGGPRARPPIRQHHLRGCHVALTRDVAAHHAPSGRSTASSRSVSSWFYRLDGSRRRLPRHTPICSRADAEKRLPTYPALEEPVVNPGRR
jgi:hypothetical protein